GELVDRDAALERDVADAEGRQARDVEGVGAGGDDLDVAAGDGGCQFCGARGAHVHTLGGPGAHEVGQCDIRQHLAATEDDDVVGGLRHLAHEVAGEQDGADRKSTRLNSSHVKISY